MTTTNRKATKPQSAFADLSAEQREMDLRLLTLLIAAHVANLPSAVVTARKMGVKCCEAWEN